MLLTTPPGGKRALTWSAGNGGNPLSGAQAAMKASVSIKAAVRIQTPEPTMSAVLRSRLSAYRLLQEVESGGDLRVVAGPDDHRLDRVLRLGGTGATGGCGARARRRVDRAAVLQSAVEIALEADHGICHLLVFRDIDDDVGRNALALNRTAGRRVI